jgi:hypothetical protein
MSGLEIFLNNLNKMNIDEIAHFLNSGPCPADIGLVNHEITKSDNCECQCDLCWNMSLKHDYTDYQHRCI